jgi:acid phosphatase (class A)
MKFFLLACVFSIHFAFSAESTPASFSGRLLTPEFIRVLLGPFPEVGSHLEEMEFQVLEEYQRTRTLEECERAAAQDHVSLVNLFAANDGPLSRAEARRLSFVLARPYAEAGANIFVAKNTFKRPRPYLSNSALKPCVPLEESTAYPSGHATISRFLGRILAEKFPERAQAIMDRAGEIAKNRVLGGVHFPSDIEAGIKLGDTLFETLTFDYSLGEASVNPSPD